MTSERKLLEPMVAVLLVAVLALIFIIAYLRGDLAEENDRLMVARFERLEQEYNLLANHCYEIELLHGNDHSCSDLPALKGRVDKLRPRAEKAKKEIGEEFKDK